MISSQEIYRSITAPENIVIVGASNDPSKPGGSVLKNLTVGDYKGTLLPVNPKSPTIMGCPAYQSIEELPPGIDLAIIAIPAPFVRQALLDLAQKETKTVMIMTAGFGEVDEKGKEEEKKFLEIAKENDMTLIGPNCVGIITPWYGGKFAGIMPELRPGTVDMISASGATVDYTMEQAELRGVKFCNVFTLGNSIQQGVEDILALTDEAYNDSSSRIIILYMESIKKPAKLIKHARSLIQKGCVLIGIKSGVTEAGSRAAASHTGAMATSDTAVQAVFDKAGIIRVHSKKELIDVACVLSLIKSEIKGNKACVITDAGGPGVMLSDELNRQGWECPVLKPTTRKRLYDVLPPQASVVNPVDCLPSQTAEQTKAIFDILETEEKNNLDVIAILTGNSMLSDKWDTYAEIVNGMNNCAIPIIPVLSPITTTAEELKKVKQMGKSFFYDEVSVGQALGKLLHRPILSEADLSADAFPGYDKPKIEGILRNSQSILTPEECAGVLMAAGINTPGQTEVYRKADLVATCETVGFPLVMKVIGPLHKSDVGGVVINISDIAEARQAWDRMMKIESATGVLLQQMITGTETIIGISKEGRFGHLIMFGLGGIYTEVLKDVSFKLCPISRDESMDMIDTIKTRKLLEGVRGEKGVSKAVLSDYLTRLSKLVTDFPGIKEIDLNPIKGTGADLYAVDFRILLEPH